MHDSAAWSEDGAFGEGDLSDIVPLTALQAQALREKHPSVSPWWVVGVQALVGVALSLLFWLVSGNGALGLSAAWGALAVVLPAALFARGITGKFASAHVGSAVAGFFVWEFVKIVVTVATMYMAHRLMGDLRWPAMLASLVITMKVYWLALGYQRRAGR